MIRLAPLITATLTPPHCLAAKPAMLHKIFSVVERSISRRDNYRQSGPPVVVATDKPTTKGEPLVSEILAMRNKRIY